MPDNSSEILHALNHNLYQSEIVESSVRREERLTGNRLGNAEQKIGAFISRLEVMMDDEPFRKRLVEHVTGEVLVEPQDIPETYWRHVEQVARDRGERLVVGQTDKDMTADRIRSVQRESIEPWFDYFEQAGGLYPLWFRVYTINAVSNMGSFDQSKGTYSRRSKGTTAPFPDLNPAVLAKTYDAITTVHSNNKLLEDVELDKLVRGGSFNKIYSRLTLQEKMTVDLPERLEEVRGVWRVYGKDDAYSIAQAAVGTPWCIASAAQARTYLNAGSEFHLFHLQDPITDLVSQTAVVSIRTVGGKIAEVSGVRKGMRQDLDDVLVPEAFKKAMTFPNGEHYIKAFADKQTLIDMDRKAQANLPFSIKELRFLYELDRPVASLNQRSWNRDPRVDEFRKSRDEHGKQFEAIYGPSAGWMVLSQFEIDSKFANWIDAGADINVIFRRISSYVRDNNVDYFLKAGIKAQVAADYLSGHGVAENLSSLLSYGAQIEIESLLKLQPSTIADCAPQFIRAGIDSETIAAKLGQQIITDKLKRLVNGGVDPNVLLEYLLPITVATNLDLLVEKGARLNVNELTAKLKPGQIARCLPQLKRAGANIDVDKLIRSIDYVTLAKVLSQIVKAEPQVNVAPIFAKLKPKQYNKVRKWLNGTAVAPGVVPR